MERLRRRADSQRALLRALRARLGDGIAIEAVRRTPWASATFVGTRHRFELRFAADAARRAALRRALPDMELALPGHLVAEMAPIEGGADGTLIVEALTIEED